MEPTSPSFVLNLSDFTTRFKPEPGAFFVVSCPVGLNPEEVEAAARGLDSILTMTGAAAIFLLDGMKMEALVDEGLSWLAREGCALRGYPVPGSQGETRYKVLHPKLGQLADEPHWQAALRVARDALGPQEVPPPPLLDDSPLGRAPGQ